MATIDKAVDIAVEEEVRMRSHRQTIVGLFMSPKLRWVANGLCPIWLVPEYHEEE